MIQLAPWEWFLRLGVALLLGGLVGLERERGVRTERAAGLRTLALVSLGSCLIMLISAYGFTAFTSADYAKVDPSRIAAQVVSGIGFLGAGAIILRRDIVRGLTTAAAIWFVAGVGLACGLGLLLEAALATILSLFVLQVLRPIERRLFPRRGGNRIHLRLAPDADPAAALAAAYDALRECGVELEVIDIPPGKHADDLTLMCRAADQRQLVQAVATLRALPIVASLYAEVQAPANGRVPSAAARSRDE